MYESDCLLHMSRNEIPFQGPLLCDDKIHRFSIDAKKNEPDEWYVAFSGSLPAGQPYLCCIYGSWSEGSKFEYKSWKDAPNKVYYSPADIKILQAKLEENRRLALIEQQKRHQEAAKKAQEIWERSSTIGEHAYLQKKKIQAYGVEFDGHSLIIPIRNLDGEIHSLQFIYQQEGKFVKRFLSGGEKKGHFHQIGDIREGSLICIAEGYATGASWHEATSLPTLIAFDYFDSGNLLDVSHHFNEISLSQEIIQEITQYLKGIYESEGRFYQEQKNRLRKEQDQIQQRLSKLYDDRYDGNVDEAFFQRKLKEYKDREFAIIQEMESHAKVDESFHVTANMVLSLAQRSREIFESSEVDEKRQLLNFVFQNLELKDKKLFIQYREPFKIIKDTFLAGKCPGMCPG